MFFIRFFLRRNGRNEIQDHIYHVHLLNCVYNVFNSIVMKMFTQPWRSNFPIQLHRGTHCSARRVSERFSAILAACQLISVVGTVFYGCRQRDDNFIEEVFAIDTLTHKYPIAHTHSVWDRDRERNTLAPFIQSMNFKWHRFQDRSRSILQVATFHIFS